MLQNRAVNRNDMEVLGAQPVRGDSMKILIYSRAFPPLVGGTETIVMLLARGLSEYRGAVFKDRPVITLVTPTPAATRDIGLPFRLVRRPTLRILVRLFREADVIHIAGPSLFAMVLGLLLQKAVVVEHHGFQTICPNGQLLHQPTQTQCPGHFMAKRYQECIRCNSKMGKLRSLKMWLLTFPRRWLCQKVSGNIFPTEWLGKILLLKKGVTIHHGIPDSGEPVTESILPIPTFTFVGRLVSTKGAQVFLAAARLLRGRGPTFRLKIIGDGPDRETLEKLVCDFKLQGCVEFSGYCSPEQLEETLKQTTALVVPSLAGEVFGLVVLENMLRKKCLVVSDIPSLHEVIGDTGLVFPAGDAEALASCMSQILQAPSLATSMGSAARTRAVQVFPLESMLDGHISLYRAVSLQMPADGTAERF
jgi:glycosyltransferase involved in cell wall biosynthesis